MGCITKERQQQSLYLAFNFLAAIGVTYANKYCFAKVKFEFPTALCNIHYVITWLGVEVMRRLGMFQPIKVVNYDKNFWAIVFFVGVVTPLNNTSLMLNSIGFYQLFKLLVSPAIVTLEYVLDGKTLSWKRSLCLTSVLAFVVLSSHYDLDYSFRGMIIACIWVPLAAGYKVQWGRVQRQQNCSTMALMHVVYPYSTCLQLSLMPLIDPPGLTSFPWTPTAAFWLIVSGGAAFLVNLSGFLVIGNISGLAHVLLGQFKTSMICLGAYYLFGGKYTTNQLLSAAGAILCTILYTYVTNEERNNQTQEDNYTKKTKPNDIEEAFHSESDRKST